MGTVAALNALHDNRHKPLSCMKYPGRDSNS